MNLHFVACGLHHVVNGEQRHRNGRQRLHLHPRAADAARRCHHLDTRKLGDQGGRHLHVVQTDRVTQRD